MSDLSKRRVMEAIEAQNQPPPQPAGLLGQLRDPVAMRAREAYNRYAIDMQQQGMPAAPFEEWYRQYQMQPRPTPTPGPRGLLDGLLGR